MSLYFDSSATVPMLPEVVETIYSEMKITWGNPSSHHRIGEMAQMKKEESRATIAKYMGAAPEEIIFTGSATESNNLAIKGYVAQHKCKVFTTLLEHKSTLLSCENAMEEEPIFLPLRKDGQIRLDVLNTLCQAHTYDEHHVFVSISYGNSEIGVIQDIPSIAEIIHKYHGILHVDATQCFTRFPISLANIDLLTAGGSKIGAGKGIGLLYKQNYINLHPVIHGGEQEFGLRGGTEDVPKICGLAKAITSRSYQDLTIYRNYFIKKLKQKYPDSRINGSLDNRLDNHISISFKNISGIEIVSFCSQLGLYISSGTACNSGSPEPSKALKAVGVPSEYMNGTIRITLPQTVSYNDIDKAMNILNVVMGLLR